MTDTKNENAARLYTAHGKKKNQGLIAIVNGQLALAYTEGKGEKEEVTGYTTFQELMQAAAQPLPQFQLEF